MNFVSQLIFFVEILGTIAFSISGAIVAIRKKMDILGVIVLGVITAVGGGIIRDLLLGITPPAAFENPVYVSWASITALIVFGIEYKWSDLLKEEKKLLFDEFLNLVDAIGLGIFATVGVQVALNAGYEDNAFLSIFVGVLTGVGGGMIRDVLAGNIPQIFCKRIYAIAALVGAIIYYWSADHMPSSASMFISSTLVVCVRLLATYYEWDLPTAKG